MTQQTQIQVWKRYTGNRSENPIEEGFYAKDSPELRGLTRYLIDNGNAIEVVQTQELLAHEEIARAVTTENDVVRAQATKAEKAKVTPLITTDPQELVEAFAKSVDEMGDALVNPEEKVTTKSKRTHKRKAKS